MALGMSTKTTPEIEGLEGGKRFPNAKETGHVLKLQGLRVFFLGVYLRKLT